MPDHYPCPNNPGCGGPERCALCVLAEAVYAAGLQRRAKERWDKNRRHRD